MPGDATQAVTGPDEYEPVDQSAGAGRPRSDALVMFGASGDLARKKLFPAVYRLHRRGLLEIPIVGVAIDDWTDDGMRHRAEEAIREAGEDWGPDSFAGLAAHMRFVAGDYADAATFDKVKVAVQGAQHPIFHLAIPPSMFQHVAEGLAGVGLNTGSRLVIEKPFGATSSPPGAERRVLHAHFAESAIFRIDHFLGKEALRRLLSSGSRTRSSSRSGTGLRLPRQDHDGRGLRRRGPRRLLRLGGPLRDVMQNHLLQMVALFAMEQPVNESAKALRDEKAKVLTAAIAAAAPQPRPTTCGASTTATSTCPACRRVPTPRPTAPSASTSTRPGGAASRSSCGPARR